MSKAFPAIQILSTSELPRAACGKQPTRELHGRRSSSDRARFPSETLPSVPTTLIWSGLEPANRTLATAFRSAMEYTGLTTAGRLGSIWVCARLATFRESLDRKSVV